MHFIYVLLYFYFKCYLIRFVDVLESTRLENDVTFASMTSLDETPPRLVMYDKGLETNHVDHPSIKDTSPMLQSYKGQLKLRIFNNYGMITVHSKLNIVFHYINSYYYMSLTI